MGGHQAWAVPRDGAVLPAEDGHSQGEADRSPRDLVAELRKAEGTVAADGPSRRVAPDRAEARPSGEAAAPRAAPREGAVRSGTTAWAPLQAAALLEAEHLVDLAAEAQGVEATEGVHLPGSPGEAAALLVAVPPVEAARAVALQDHRALVVAGNRPVGRSQGPGDSPEAVGRSLEGEARSQGEEGRSRAAGSPAVGGRTLRVAVGSQGAGAHTLLAAAGHVLVAGGSPGSGAAELHKEEDAHTLGRDRAEAQLAELPEDLALGLGVPLALVALAQLQDQEAAAGFLHPWVGP